MSPSSPAISGGSRRPASGDREKGCGGFGEVRSGEVLLQQSTYKYNSEVGEDPLKKDDCKGASSNFFALLIDFPPCDDSKRDLTRASVPEVFGH